ncbi:MAG TPA: rhomboid family intramembrane serine protease [Candidatus Brocadiia bacterium]|nr:rhomboid family intramembrane serine protease [Candidatus Brocadiia bacterium]
MNICPKCNSPLVKAKSDKGLFWVCKDCGGRAANVSLLRKLLPPAYVNGIWTRAKAGTGQKGRPCPFCGRNMREVPAVLNSENPLMLDVCASCQTCWFDPMEFSQVPIKPVETKSKKLSPKAAEAMGKFMIAHSEEERASSVDYDADAPDSVIGQIAGYMGLPVETDAPELMKRPWLTWSLALVISVVSIWAIFAAPGVLDKFGFIPAMAWRCFGLTSLTSFFLHAGLAHLLGNMYFLIVFGDNVEDSLGRLWYGLLLLLATVTGDACHYLLDTQSAIPAVGASGGISGIIAYYAFRFPKSRLGLARGLGFGLGRWLARYRWITMPAWFAFALWIGIQLIGAWMQIKGFSNVSAAAHIGGAAVGFAFWLGFRGTNL